MKCPCCKQEVTTSVSAKIRLGLLCQQLEMVKHVMKARGISPAADAIEEMGGIGKPIGQIEPDPFPVPIEDSMTTYLRARYEGLTEAIKAAQ